MIELTSDENVTQGARLVVQGLVKRYPRATGNAVDGLDFHVRAGEVFGLLGPNGAGKTTTVAVASTRALASAGSVLLAGTDVAKHPSRARRKLGVVTQVNTLDRSLRVGENLYCHCRYFGLSRQDAKRRTDELLSRFDLAGRRDDRVDRLSGGLAQRLQLARALAHRPTVLFLDEPTSGLDPQSRLALWDSIRLLREQDEVTVLLTTHYMEEADRLCDRVAIIDHGQILVCDTPAALKRELGERTNIELRFDEPPAAGLLDRLGELAGVERVIDGGQAVQVLTAERDGILPQLVSTTGRGLRDLSVTEPTLESVFISLTGRKLRD